MTSRWTKRANRHRAPATLPPIPRMTIPATVDTPDTPDAAASPLRATGEAAVDPRSADLWALVTDTARASRKADRAIDAAIAANGYTIADWDRFRREVAIRPPPAGPCPPRLTVMIDASHAAPFLIRATLRSLQDQSVEDWSAFVLGPDDLRDHPVGSFATTDPRISFESPDLRGDAPVVLIDSGTYLDPEALAWLGFTIARTGVTPIFCDHDHGVLDPAIGPVRADPMLYGCHDRALLTHGAVPALVVATGEALAGGRANAEARRTILGAATKAVHVPRALATRLSLPLIARGGRETPEDAVPGRLGPAVLPSLPHTLPTARDDRIAIVIPTRDGADLLARAIETLRATARNAARLDIVVVDNASSAPETARLFDALDAEGSARRIAFDAPFNWSRASNLGAQASDAPVIVFANNDIEMLSAGWDDRLLEALADPAIGVVGARLLYPDNTIQHAGVAFGFGPGGAEHEGRGIPADEPGPGRRYVLPHAVASVTGAFLALRRADFEAIGGFDDARLMIGHSDVDLCLKVRERGRTVLYEPAIEAVHHEGATRGRNETRAAIAWDEGERADLIARWGEELGEDPGMSPYWMRGLQPFETLREPPLPAILRHLDRSARPDPWTPSRA